jgi:hypothetical protein
MITFHNELPLDHTKSLRKIVMHWAVDIYLDEEGTGNFFRDRAYYEESAWNSLWQHLSSEDKEVNVPVGKTYWELAHG